MMQSLRSRLIVLVSLLCIAGVAASSLMIGLFFQSASAQAGQAQAEVARACDSIASTYRFYSASWQGPKTSLQDTALRSGLTTVAQTALRNRFGIEGGLWAADSGSLAYAYPTYQGAGPKLDFPLAETARIRSINTQARADDRTVTERYAASTQVLLLAACPLNGPIPGLTAWTMTRVVTFAGSAYRQLMAGLAVLLATVVAATTLLIRLTVSWSRHVGRIEQALQADDLLRLPQIEATGEKELDQIIEALNRAGHRLAAATDRAEQLARQVATGERLAAIGRVAAGVAHEIRNPIAAMLLKAESALTGDVTRKNEALRMIVGQVGRLDRLLTRLLSLTDRDPAQRQATDVAALVEGCLGDHAELARAKEVVLQQQVTVESARIDPEQIRRALDNLVLNAIQAAPRGSEIVVRAQVVADRLILSVRDQGAGPPPAIRDHLFEPFVTGRAEGTGLGLSLVREIAVAHGGTARLADSADGTTFEILLSWP
jgi:signal transduction histidine kinase